MKIPPVKILFPPEDRQLILRLIDEALTTGQLTLGKNGAELERLFAAYVGTRYAIAVNSGTSALEIALRALEVQGKEVIVPTNTFFATAAAVVHAGGRVKFVECDPTTFAIDPASLKRAITPETAGVIIVHIGGTVSHRLPEILALCRERGIFLLEDAAHAHGSSLNGRKAGTFGIAAAFSFYPTKVMTSGEGGILVTDDERIYQEALIYRDQGKASFLTNEHTRMGYNWRMSELHAILGASQLRRLDEYIAERRRIAAIYHEALAHVQGIKPLISPEGSYSNYYKYIALLEPGIDRKEFKGIIREKHEVSLSGEVYDLPLHLQPIFSIGYKAGDFPKAEEICQRHVCLPIYPYMTREETSHVIQSIEQTLKSARARSETV